MNNLEVIAELHDKYSCGYNWTTCQIAIDIKNRIVVRSGSGCSCNCIEDESWDLAESYEEVKHRVESDSFDTTERVEFLSKVAYLFKERGL